jgi:transitional endoplasmic reticulum ATPase
MDGLDDASGVTVLATTNRLDAIDPALRRGGRFEKEIRIAAPDRHGREEVLSIHLRGVAAAVDVDLRQVSDETVGFVGADLAALCREAAYCAIRRLFTEEQLRQGTAAGDIIQIELADFRMALKDVPPSALREFYVEIPDDVTWDSIGGLSDAKQLIEENVVRPLQVPEAFAFIGAEPAQGLLLYGPPGTGKTHLARVTARRAGVNFIAIRGPELESKWRGEAERRLREVFSSARESAPCIIFFDEIDAIASQRRGAAEHEVSLLNQLLAEMDGIQPNSNVFVLAATNRVDIIDPALLRSGRFDYQVEVPLPDLDARRQIFAIHMRTIRAGELDYCMLAQKTDGFSGADIAEICRRAALGVLRAAAFRPLDTTRVQMDDVLGAVEHVRKLMADVKPRRIGFQRRT